MDTVKTSTMDLRIMNDITFLLVYTEFKDSSNYFKSSLMHI